jgi:hypothetical protein
VVGGGKPPQLRADERRRSSRWLAHAAFVLRAVVLSVPAYSAFFRPVVTSQ